MDVVLVKNANRMMTTASLVDDGIELSFADGLKGLIPYGEVPEVKAREGISGLELPNPYEMVLRIAGGESVEIPWDFRPALLRHSLPANHRSHSSPGEADHRGKGAPVPGVCWPDTTGAGAGCTRREGYAGEAGERRTVPQVQDPESGR